jgi:hypothetical protein
MFAEQRGPAVCNGSNKMGGKGGNVYHQRYGKKQKDRPLAI